MEEKESGPRAATGTPGPLPIATKGAPPLLTGAPGPVRREGRFQVSNAPAAFRGHMNWGAEGGRALGAG